MKTANLFIFPLAVVIVATTLAGCSKPAGDPPADPPEKTEARAGITIDVATQERIGLKMETPGATAWQPQLRAVGLVVNPLAFTTAASDYESAQAAADASHRELERTQKLAEQNNTSPRVLEAAQAAAAHDLLALQSARAKFTSEWGVHLAAQTNLIAFAEKLQADDHSLVKLSLAVGTFPNPLPKSAAVYLFSNETNAIPAELADDLGIDPATQVETLLFSVDRKLPPSVAVTGLLQTSGAAINGVAVPAGAVLRHEGKGWAYVQTETNQFLRVEVPLDRLTGDGGYFSETLSATNRIVVSGAQTVLSTELGGGFNTGARD